MQYVQFGSTGMKVSRFTLGAMDFPNRLDLTTSARIIDEAIDHGINFIDTADSYGNSEEVLGKIITQEKREKLFLSTKVYLRHCRNENVTRNSRTNIINSLERSLRLLNTDYVDLYMLHHPDPETPIDETLLALDNLVQQGKIRYYGVSNHYAWQMAYMLGESKLRGLEPMVSVQVCYSVLERQLEHEMLPFLQKFNIPTMCYSPLAAGVLTGKYTNGIPEQSRVGKSSFLQNHFFNNTTVPDVLNKLPRIAEKAGVEMNQLAILWLMSKPHVTTIILGGSQREHYLPMFDIIDQELSPEIVQKIDDLSHDRIYTSFLNQGFPHGPGHARC